MCQQLPLPDHPLIAMSPAGPGTIHLTINLVVSLMGGVPVQINSKTTLKYGWVFVRLSVVTKHSNRTFKGRFFEVKIVIKHSNRTFHNWNLQVNEQI